MGFYDSFGKKNLIGGHRGWRQMRPENTLSAFQAAVGHFDFVELDIRLSRDKKWIVCHDESLERTTDVETRFPEGLRPRRVIDHSLEQLRSLDAGSWYLARDPYGLLSAGKLSRREIEALLPQRLPTLDEVLHFAGEKRMPLNIEIKDMPTLPDEEVVARFIESAGNALAQLPILVSSFNHRYLRRLHELRPSLSLAALVDSTHPPRLVEYLKSLGVEAYHVNDSISDSTPIEKLNEQKIRCGVFVVNDPIRQTELFRQGFRALFSDRPAENP